MKINHFEEIQAWQEARKLAKEIYNFTKRLGFRKDFNLTSQIQRAVISVMANIAEGFDRQSKKEFVQYLYIARGSLYETVTLLIIMHRNNWITDEQLDSVKNFGDEIGKMLSMLINTIKKKLIAMSYQLSAMSYYAL